MMKTIILFWILDSNIDNNGARTVSEWLRNNNTMKSLDLSSENGNQHRIKKKPLSSHSLKTMVENRIGNEGARMIGESLRSNTSLTVLNLRGWNSFLWSVRFIHNTPARTDNAFNNNEGARIMVESLRNNSSLTKLTLPSKDYCFTYFLYNLMKN